MHVLSDFHPFVFYFCMRISGIVVIISVSTSPLLIDK